VIGVSKLGKKYKQFEQKRRLCAAYSLFISDDRVYSMLPHILGKTFYDRRKWVPRFAFLTRRMPIPINATKKDLAKEILSVRNKTTFQLTEGSCWCRCCSVVFDFAVGSRSATPE
jgi:ribosome biogenesis protein UTP30